MIRSSCQQADRWKFRSALVKCRDMPSTAAQVIAGTRTYAGNSACLTQRSCCLISLDALLLPQLSPVAGSTSCRSPPCPSWGLLAHAPKDFSGPRASLQQDRAVALLARRVRPPLADLLPWLCASSCAMLAIIFTFLYHLCNPPFVHRHPSARQGSCLDCTLPFDRPMESVCTFFITLCLFSKVNSCNHWLCNTNHKSRMYHCCIVDVGITRGYLAWSFVRFRPLLLRVFSPARLTIQAALRTVPLVSAP